MLFPRDESKTWMKRTPRSANRRANSSCLPIGSVTGLPNPYSFFVNSLSLSISNASGART
jgi:hypothetical protein